MADKVYANGRRVIHAGDGQTFVSAAPDVCKTPGPSGPIPVPYPNTAKSGDLAGGTKKVTIGGSAVAVRGATLRTSTGDEAGTAGGGLMSGKTKGALSWGSCSLDVCFEGQGVIRFFEPTLHNGNMANASSVSPGDSYMMAPEDPEAKCLHCGKPFDDHEFPEIKTDVDQYRNGADKFRKQKSANTVGGLQVDCGGSVQTFTAHAGQMQGWLPSGGPILNFKTGNPISLERPHLRALERGANRYRVGNCVEQKALHQAWVNGKGNFPFDCAMTMGVGANLGGPSNKTWSAKELKKKMLAPCYTCRDVMMAMLCQNDPKK